MGVGVLLYENPNYMGFRNKPEGKSGSDPGPSNYNAPSLASRSLNCIAN